MTRPGESPPAAVSQTKQAGEARAGAIRSWAERAVWTDRMLEALEHGVKGGVWYSLMDKVCRAANLRAAFQSVKRNRGAAGVDHVTVAGYEARLEGNLRDLETELRAGTYRPRANRRVYIDKPGGKGQRPLGIPAVRDRVAETALKHALEPVFEAGFSERSYGFRPGRGQKDALRRTVQLLEAGCRWVVDADIRSYFDTIPKDRLLERVRRKIADGRVLELIERYLNQAVLEELREWTPEAGTPQGAVISPLLSNIYLDPLDHALAAGGFELVRYADDLIILCRSGEEARRALDRLQEWMGENGLSLHPEKTRRVDMNQPGAGFDFLGYHFETSRKRYPRLGRWPTRRSERKLHLKLKPLTRRANGHSLEEIIRRINPILRGWYQYFQHSRPNTFIHLDGWVRARLRGILRKRRKGRGRATGDDHHRWPNAYFQERGLFSMSAAQASTLQSLAR